MKFGDFRIRFWLSTNDIVYIHPFFLPPSLEQMTDSFLGTSAVLEWRYSFSQAEMGLSDHVPKAARTSYLAFKAVIKTHINRVFDANGLSHKIPSYALKTILFYEMENLPANFNAKDMEERLFWLLFDSLEQKIRCKKCPHFCINGFYFVFRCEGNCVNL